jgi:hypothetical protein
MHKRTLRSLGAAIVLILMATVTAHADSVSVVTSLGALAANDTIVWSQLGVDATTLTATPSFTSAHGLTGSVSLSGPNSLVAVVCPETLCSWNVADTTGFAVGDSLIWTADTGNSGNGPLIVNFTSKSVSGAGAFLQSDGNGQFTAQIEAFNGGTSLGTFTATSDISGDAIFIGVLDSTGANITSVVFSTIPVSPAVSCLSDCTDFAIDTVSMRVPGGGTPTATATGGTPTPTATATRTATPTITPTATPTPVPARLNIKPTHENFGKVKVGHDKVFTFTLSNSAKKGAPISFGAPLATVSNFPAFGFPENGTTTCGAQLLPKKKCKLKVEFGPQAPGATSATLTIFDNATGANQTVPLSGTGQ